MHAMLGRITLISTFCCARETTRVFSCYSMGCWDSGCPKKTFYNFYTTYTHIFMKCSLLPRVYSYTKTLFVVDIYNFGDHEGMCVSYILSL